MSKQSYYIQDNTHPDNHIVPTYEVTPGFKWTPQMTIEYTCIKDKTFLGDWVQYYELKEIFFINVIISIPVKLLGIESIAHEADGRMGYGLRGHEGERNNCFSKIQLVGQKLRE